ncbi:MAG: DUF1552 domain-containing protein [Planctomycetota bacterium]|nr:DUF1552 domain-containing protein [Planctomycetota bacterium]
MKPRSCALSRASSLSPSCGLSRRTFFRATGVGLSLPWLDAMQPAIAHESSNIRPRRMVLINKALGLHGPDFFPKQKGSDFELTPYLKEFAALRGNFTVFSGLSHPEAGGGHSSEQSFLTAAPHSGTPAFRNTISLDQLVAEQISDQTRHSFLALGSHSGSLSWTRNGVQIPADKDPATVFRRLFITGTPAEIRDQEQQLRDGNSILDSVREETAALQRRVGPGDRDRIDQYFSAVRDVEKRLKVAESWSHKPKPDVKAEVPGDYPDGSDIVGRMRMMLDLAYLALQTDSTRLITFAIDVDGGVPPIEGVKESRHNLSHHGQDPSKIDQLRRIELAELQALNDFLTKLQSSDEAGGRILDQTQVLFGSNLGNASSHDTRNLPVLLFGGDFKHGQHLAFDQKNNTPLANLFVTMLQRMGIDTDRFGNGTSSLTGLEFS